MNQNSDFNFITAQGCIKAQDYFRKEGWLMISYLGNTNNGVSSYGPFTKMSLTNDLNGDLFFSGHSDPNHNIKKLGINW